MTVFDSFTYQSTILKVDRCIVKGYILGFITAIGLAVGAITIRSAKSKNLVPAAVVGKLFVAMFALFFIENQRFPLVSLI